MENPFKKILTYEELPPSFKDKVMRDIALLKLSLDMADLFVVKYPSTINEFLKEKPKRKK
jgi:hypothetical protein